MGENQVKVTVVADQSELDGAIDLSVEKLKKSAKELDIFNATAVKAFFESAEATKKLNVELGATSAQLEKIQQVTEAVASRADAAGTRTANAFERGARGMSVMIRQGDATMRSLDQVIASGADLAFAFGPEGAIVSGILMMTAGLVAHFETVEAKMVEVADKYTEHLADLVANSSLTEIAKRSADAYIGELEAQAKLLRDKQLGTWYNILVEGNSDAVFAKFRQGREERDVLTNRGKIDASTDATRVVASIDGSEKDLEKLKGERTRLNADIASAEEHLRGLDRDKNAHEIAETQARLAAAQQQLARTEAITRQLEADRAARLKDASDSAILSGNGVLAAAVDERASRYKPADIAGEHAQRDENVRMSATGSAGRKQDQGDAAKSRERDAALEREARGQEMLMELEDQILERHLRALDMKEAADIMAAQREFQLNAARILNMKISEQLKTDLMVAAEKDRNEKMGDVINKSSDDAVKAAIAVLDKQLKAENAARNQRARVIEGVEKNLAHALVAHHKDMGREILRALLEPEVKHLEALGAKQFVIGSADAAIGNYKGAAEHFAAGALYMAGATAVAAIGGAGGGGGGGGGSGGSGGSDSVGLGARGNGAGDQVIKIEIVNVTKDQTGREVARTTQLIQRLTDTNYPIRVGALG